MEIQMNRMKERQNIWAALAGAVIAATVALPQVVTAQPSTAQTVTYAGDIAAIVQEN